MKPWRQLFFFRNFRTFGNFPSLFLVTFADPSLCASPRSPQIGFPQVRSRLPVRVSPVSWCGQIDRVLVEKLSKVNFRGCMPEPARAEYFQENTAIRREYSVFPEIILWRDQRIFAFPEKDWRLDILRCWGIQYRTEYSQEYNIAVHDLWKRHHSAVKIPITKYREGKRRNSRHWKYFRSSTSDQGNKESTSMFVAHQQSRSTCRIGHTLPGNRKIPKKAQVAVQGKEKMRDNTPPRISRNAEGISLQQSRRHIERDSRTVERTGIFQEGNDGEWKHGRIWGVIN